MKRLAWLALAVAVFYAHPSHAVSMALCPDNAHYYPVSEGVGYCPPQISITGTTPTATGATVSGTVSIATGTVFVSVRLNCDAVHWRDVVDSIGDEAYGTDATVTDGTFSVSIAGLAESTAYCAHASQYVTINRPAKAATQAFTTTDATPPAEGVGDEITGGDDWFYCPDGSNANSGLTHAQRRATLPSTDTSVMSGGDDMWLCTGGVWSQIKHTVARAGTSGNRNEIGTYYMDSTTPRKAVDGVRGLGTTHTKAEIRGGLNQTCIDARTCTYPSTGFPIDGVSSIYDSHLVIASTADYTTVQSIVVSYTRYGTITYTGGGRFSADQLHHVTFDGVDVTYTGHQAAIVGIDGVQDIIIRNSTGYYMSTCFSTKQSPKVSADTSACEAVNPYFPNTFVQVTRSNSSRVLIENNDFARGFGEGIGMYNNNSTMYSVVRGNRGMNTWSDVYFFDGTGSVVLENNIGVGGNGSMDSAVTGSGAFSCIHIGSENGTFANPTGFVVRNNLCVGGGYGFHVDLFPSAISAGDQIGAKVYGNTFIAAETYDVWNEIPVANTTEMVLTGNVFWSALGAGVTCIEQYNAGTYLDNHWPENPSDSGCDGSGDTYGDPGLTLSAYASWTALREQSGASPTWPTFADANPAGGSAILGTGTSLTSAVLDVANFGQAWTEMTDAPSEADWECALCLDATGAARATPPSKGAVE